MRCPRCGAERDSDAAACPRCGAAAPAPGSRPAPPSTAGQLNPPTGPAPWQSPPQASAPGPATGSAPRWLPGQETGTEEIESPAPQYSVALARLVGLALVLEAVVAFAYGMFAALERRGIFAALADDPSSVTSDEAGRSDLINRIAFITGGIVSAVALVLVVIWILHVRRVGGKIPLRLPWLAVAVLAVAGIAYALALHSSDDVEQITYGYLIFAIAALLTAAAAVLGLVVLRRTDAQLTPAPDNAEPDPAPSWPVPRP